ncbi:hypothetical protein BH708_02500 [Brachybacterium sp. P6-10-X1]|uniref:helix-turn-helix transcriptional regulator n=1 Tax=Brachybacterium sp. P6-10-X1 TaxID=1903186 RepID=UPI0009717E10|nr:helix-turn-helix transcriptional regulator [Brachybacterium sp. P6-10-X1]APX31772.1 hypothetical protein BH708_02500 [Brachybacterium sp. P6-10-X1]
MSPRTQPQRDASASSYWKLRCIGAVVAIRRSELELDQADLAARLGVPTATVVAIEAGRYDPRLALIPRLETALAMTPGSIGGDPCPSASRPRQVGSR